MKVQITLTILVVLVEPSFNSEFCENSDTCNCLKTGWGDFEVSCQCPGGELTLHIKLGTKITFQCEFQHGSDWNLVKFPNLTVGRLETVEFRYCPQPNNLMDLLKLLGVYNFEKLKFLMMDENQETVFRKDIFEDLEFLETLQLDVKNIGPIYKDLFTHLKQLKELNLNKNKIRNLHESAFEKLPHLLKLEMSYNQLRTLRPSLLHPLTNLQVLHLFKNNLKTLPRNLFNKCSDLVQLELSNNPLDTLDPQLFHFNPNLTELILRNTHLIEIPGELFQNNHQLQSLSLDKNVHLKLTNFLKDLTSLTKLTLKECRLTNVPENFFGNNADLERLELDKNLITNMPTALLSNLSSLKHLSLSNNRIQTISPHFFMNLHELKVLNLDKNRLETIGDEMFADLGQLEELLLSNNRIKSISSFCFTHLKKMVMLDLSKNLLSAFPNVPKGGLEEIKLNNNKIIEFNADLSLLVHLKKVRLQNNAINELNCSLFKWDNVFNLEIDLQNNNIRKVYFNGSKDGKRDIILDLDNNPFMCDCRLYAFVKYMQDNRRKGLKTRGKLICHPSGVSLTFVPLDTLICPVQQCPDSCDCFRRIHDKGYIVDCSNKNLTEAPKLEKPDINTNHTLLNLTGNNLEKFIEMGDGYFNVTSLYLGGNRVRELKWIPPRIEVLTLNNNALRRVDEKIIAQLNRSSELKHLSFENNPWICDCTTAQFSNFLRHQFTSNRIMGKNIKCAQDGRLLINLNSKNLCRNTSQILLTSGLVLLSLLAIVLVLTALYYRFTQEVKVWLFAHNIFLWFVTEEELDKDKLYDAFVSFAHQDQQFISQELLPVLEYGPERYKLCLHLRDWVGGEAIMNQIAYSVENSRRTIVILSENFLKSAWATTEFRLAHQKALRERRARIIVIIYGDVNPEEIIDEELKAYLRTNTYVKWGDRWFWEKIKYAMPHTNKRAKNSNMIYVNVTMKPLENASRAAVEISLDPLLNKLRQDL